LNFVATVTLPQLRFLQPLKPAATAAASAVAGVSVHTLSSSLT